MKLIGKGWQYRVYDIGNGRVRKIKRTPLDTFCRLFFMPKPVKENRKFRFNPVLSYQEMQRISRESDETIRKLKKILPSIPGHLLGNPIFLRGIDFEQDYATPLIQYFRKHDNQRNRELVTRYIELIVELWKYGCSDDIFNFYANSGFDKNGRVIMIDFGELIFFREEIEKSIKTKKWLTQPFHAFFKDFGLYDHFQKEMDRLITPYNLDKNWRSSYSS
jgi:hypothetical protein